MLSSSHKVLSFLKSLSEKPYHAYKTVHVTGTNGKGSVSVKIAQAFISMDLKVGLFTSPHIVSELERFVINNVKISAHEYQVYERWIRGEASEQRILLHQFDLWTLVALFYFRDHGVDVAVFEVGIGGRSDSTNVIEPILTVITSISLDHTELLGNTEEVIAFEKAGIIKRGVPVVIGPSADYKPIMNEAFNYEAPLLLTYFSKDSTVEEENRAIAKAAMGCIKEKYPVDDESYLLATLPCRFEKIKIKGVELICDMAHNEDAIKRLFKRIKEEYSGRKVTVLFGVKRKKCVVKMLEIVNRSCDKLYFVTAPNCMSVEELLALSSKGKKAKVRKIVEEATCDDLLVLCGSSCLKGVYFSKE